MIDEVSSSFSWPSLRYIGGELLLQPNVQEIIGVTRQRVGDDPTHHALYSCKVDAGPTGIIIMIEVICAKKGNIVPYGGSISMGNT